MRSQRGFSFVELLVVLTVISVLLVLTLPFQVMARRKAQQAGSLHNVQQLTLAAHGNAGDTGVWANYENPGDPRATWMGADYYTQNPKILVCPATRVEKPVLPTLTPGAAEYAWTFPGDKNVYVGSYGLNGWLYDQPSHGGMRNPDFMMSKQSAIQRPAMTPGFFDAIWPDLWPLETDPPATDLYYGKWLGRGIGRCTISRHGGVNPAKAPQDFDPRKKMPGAINIGFVDGHADTVKLENLWNLSWHLDWKTPSQRPQ